MIDVCDSGTDTRESFFLLTNHFFFSSFFFTDGSLFHFFLVFVLIKMLQHFNFIPQFRDSVYATLNSQIEYFRWLIKTSFPFIVNMIYILLFPKPRLCEKHIKTYHRCIAYIVYILKTTTSIIILGTFLCRAKQILRCLNKMIEDN